MASLEAVVFDFGNVLATIDRQAMCAALARHSPLSAAEILGGIWGTEIERSAETGVWDSREQFQRIRARIEGERSWTYEEFLAEFLEGIEANAEGIEAMRLARGRGKRIFVLSNTSYAHARWLLGREDIVSLVEAFVFSFKVGAMKPDAAIWRHLLANTGLAAASCLYVDDVPEFCSAAGRLGFATINYVKGRTGLLQELRRAL